MAAKADETSGGETLDKVLSKLDALHGRMDAMELGAGSKAPLKKSDDDDDDDDKRKDEEEEKDKKKDDEEEEEKKEEKKEDARKDQLPSPKGNVGATAPPPVVADKKRKDDDDDDGDLEMKHEGKELVHKGDKRKDKRKDDDDDDDDDDKRADSIADLRRVVVEQSKVIKRLEGRMRPLSDDDHTAFAEAQAKADAVFNGFGKRAPRPLEGESLLDYRRRLASHLKPHSTQWKGVKFSLLPEAAFSIAETQVYADATNAASTPTDLADGELREVTRRDPRTNITTTVFYGRESFVKGLGRPPRRVASFRTQHST
jgi:hypothetical protein